MKLLLDTHIWLWMLVSPEKLHEPLATALVDPENELYLSAASSWEIAIKYRLGRLPLPMAPAEYIPSRLAKSGTLGLPIEHRHATHVADLPMHHRDPFDRLLIAQAQLENATLVTAHAQMQAYDVPVMTQ